MASDPVQSMLSQHQQQRNEVLECGNFDQYTLLTTASVVHYVEHLRRKGGALPDEARLQLSQLGNASDWELREIGDGNLNFVFTISNRTTGKVLLLKQAIPYVRCVGPQWPLTTTRALFEARAMKEHFKHAPLHVPELYYFDDVNCVIMEEFLENHQILRKEVLNCHVLPRLHTHMASYLASTLFNTSYLKLNISEQLSLQNEFSGNSAMIAITSDVVFTEPFISGHKNNHWTSPQLDTHVARLQESKLIKRVVRKLKRDFLCRREALLHADLHSGSIMVTEASTKVIDAEFAYVGPMSFDVGQYLAHLIIPSIALAVTSSAEKHEYIHYLSLQIISFWRQFVSMFGGFWKHHDPTLTEHEDSLFFSELLQESCQMAAVEIIRRIIGVAHVEDFESIQEPSTRAQAEGVALELAQFLLEENPPLLGKIESLTTIVDSHSSKLL